ncbi:hypothetical protein NSB25_25885 [Acetatifactor muris]|uniref:Uncharacterized protein n=1 Tax=Acetatifactor muris TaxID=879566 RepID=A0A2K4ZP32_9FIRM|nr:hypothetical protein [Acetatifactor muris]MCR2050668.1 hypothetical protein [Acetatifactor muris]SOY32215.1 hypothetical protein AMURIS_04973 [Acetatifactor muris]
MKINKESLLTFLMYNKPIPYNKSITLTPVTMNDVISFHFLSKSIIVRKNSTFHDKKIIKMSYLEFLFYSFGNQELEEGYKIVGLSQYLFYFIELIKLCCKDAEIRFGNQFGSLYINNFLITPEVFDDLRRIIIIQNDIDFDIDEFINYETEQRLLKAQKEQNKNNDKSDIEDYVDSLIIALNTTEEHVMNMTIRKFWRYIKRYQLHERYTIAKTGECSGMVTYKEPIRHWMISLEEDDKYGYLKTDENELREKIG